MKHHVESLDPVHDVLKRLFVLYIEEERVLNTQSVAILRGLFGIFHETSIFESALFK